MIIWPIEMKFMNDANAIMCNIIIPIMCNNNENCWKIKLVTCIKIENLFEVSAYNYWPLRSYTLQSTWIHNNKPYIAQL